MYLKFRATYDHNHDSFRIEFLLLPCVVLALLINHDFTVLEVSFPLSDVCQSSDLIKNLVSGIMDVFYLLGVCRNPPTTVSG